MYNIYTVYSDIEQKKKNESTQNMHGAEVIACVGHHWGAFDIEDK